MQYIHSPTEDTVATILPEHRSRRFNSSAIQSFLLESNTPPARLAEVDKKYILDFRKNAAVLEIGCGIGNTLFDLTQRYGTHSLGIDLKAGAGFPTPTRGSIAFDNQDICLLPEQFHNSFDLAYSYYTWHYLGDKLGALRNVHLALKTGGSALIDFGSFEVSRDTDSPQLYDPLISPDLATLLEHSDHRGQITWERVPIFDVSGRQERRCCRVLITKSSEAAISFPFFEGVRRNEAGVKSAFRTASYSTELSDSTTAFPINADGW